MTDVIVQGLTIEELDQYGVLYGEIVANALESTLIETLTGSPDALVAAGFRDVLDRLRGRPTPSDVATLPATWRERVRSLSNGVRRVFGASATRTRTQSIDTVAPPRAWMARVTSGADARTPQAADALWRNLVSAGMPLVSQETSDTVVRDTVNELDRLGEELRERIERELIASRERDEDAEQLARRLIESLEITQNHARAIARTEVARAANSAALAQMRTTGLTGIKIWQTVGDLRVRPAHAETNTQERNVRDTFDVAGFPMQYPGDPVAPPELRINCRCDMAFRVPDTQTPEWAVSLAAGPMSPNAVPPVWDDGSARDEDTLELPSISDTQENPVNASAAPDPTGSFVSNMPAQLKRYWLSGEGALLVAWGTPGSFMRCVNALRDDFPQNPEGLCANLYKDATGRWPGDRDDTASLAVLDDDGMPQTEVIDIEAPDRLDRDDAMDTCPDPDDTGDWEWERQIVVEGVPSGDGRLFMPGSLVMESPPLPFAWQESTAPRHDNAVSVGRIDEIWRDGDVIMGRGVIGLDTDAGRAAARGMCRGYQRGISIDADMISGEIAEDDDGLTTEVYASGRIRGATLVMTPAYTDGSTMDIPSIDSRRTVVDDAMIACGCDAALSNDHVITIPNIPPAEWFTKPRDVEMHGALTVTDQGRVFGYLAPDGVAHRSYLDRNVYAPRGVDYSLFLGGETIVAGGRVVTGPITMGCGHASTSPGVDAVRASDHYDNTCSVAANVAVGEDDQGVWVAGALTPGVTPDQVVRMMGCRLSGDWRPSRNRAGVRELTAALLVPTPGFATARTRASVMVEDGAMVASSVPVEFSITNGVKPVDESAPLNRVMSSLARSLGRDRRSRVAELSHTIHGK